MSTGASRRRELSKLLDSLPYLERVSVTSYIKTMLWSSSDTTDEGEDVRLDEVCDQTDLSIEALNQCIEDWLEFVARCSARGCSDFGAHHTDKHNTIKGNVMAAHDFWLTRTGHGVGFWDGDYISPWAEELTKIAESMGDVTPYIGDDGLIYF